MGSDMYYHHHQLIYNEELESLRQLKQQIIDLVNAGEELDKLRVTNDKLNKIIARNEAEIAQLRANNEQLHLTIKALRLLLTGDSNSEE